MKCIVAEDDPVSRRLLMSMLAARGYAPQAHEDGDAAWAAIEAAGEPVLAVIDWMMPGLDGAEICRRVRSLPAVSGSYVILLTARVQRADIVQGLDAGADDYLTKPFDPTELAARLRAGERILGLQVQLRQRVTELEKAVSTARTLAGMLPICCYCKRIRRDDDYWQQVEEFVAAHTHAEFSHGICPECLTTHFETPA
jgi:sigma-B regulation protein RsbU (phosphoserine phosphatase)